ncbi:hypothetical protein [endosymbiont of Lamellibrachia barhami]|uniref:hypothetical protein n=1 Tax=endosymbiont of Lamellibrachia barhami TaxID=205975 RepID=UPI0015AD9F92|nr:hypothetical protein [endosymbiont of Lamellibrachia barhami]
MGWGLFRSSQAHWFEVYVPRDQTVHAIEVLAETGDVQLELDPRQTTHLNVKVIKSLIREFDSFCGSHNLSLPSNNAIPAHLVGEPDEVAKSSVDYFRRWAARLFAIQNVLKLLQGEKADLSLLDACLTALESNASGIESFSHDTDFLFKGVYACPQHHPLNVSLKEIFSEKVSGATHDFFLAGLPDRNCWSIIWLSLRIVFNSMYQSGCRETVMSRGPLLISEWKIWTRGLQGILPR